MTLLSDIQERMRDAKAMERESILDCEEDVERQAAIEADAEVLRNAIEECEYCLRKAREYLRAEDHAQAWIAIGWMKEHMEESK